MKKIILAMLASLSLATTAFAQGAMPTPPTLPDGTAVAGHLTASLGSGAVPVLSGASCGTPVLTAGSTDFAGTFQSKGIATCKVTFGKAFANTPFCVVQNATTPADAVFTFSTSGTTTTGFTMGTTVINDLVTWHCVGQQGN